MTEHNNGESASHRYWQSECHFEHTYKHTCHILEHIYTHAHIHTAKINKMSNNVAKAIYVGWIGFFTFVRVPKLSNHFPIFFKLKMLFLSQFSAYSTRCYKQRYDVSMLRKKTNLTTKSIQGWLQNISSHAYKSVCFIELKIKIEIARQ